MSNDKATTEIALKHCLMFMKKIKKISPSIIVYLQVTEPLRKLWMIDKCILTLKKNKKLIQPSWLKNIIKIFGKKKEKKL